MNDNNDRPDESRLSADRETIRGWADEHGATPVRHRDDPDSYRIVRESDTTESHETADWDDFFGQLEEGDQVVIYHGAEASEPFEVAHREDALTRTGVEGEDLEQRLVEGETVTTQVTETTVVESVVVEEATIESELVDVEVIDESVVDVELLSRDCTVCNLVEEGAAEHADWFDETRYFDAVGRGGTRRQGGGTETTDAEMERTDAEMGQTDAEMGQTDAEMTASPLESTANVPYYAELDVEEMWAVTREFTERFTVESHVEDTDVVETDTVEDRDIDIDGLQRTIAESDILEIDLSPDDVLTECEIETEFSEDDRIHTHFSRERVVEDEIVDRKRLDAEVTGGELMAMETVHTEDVLTEDAGAMSSGTAGTEATGTAAEEPAGTAADETAGTTAEEPAGGMDRVTVSEDDVGKTVVDDAGEEIGMVTEVEADDRLYVDPEPGVTEKIKAALGWGNVEHQDDVPMETEQIRRVTDDRVELKGAEELESGDRHR